MKQIRQNLIARRAAYRRQGSQKMADFIGFSHRRYATVSPLPKSFKLHLIFWLLNLMIVRVLFPLLERIWIIFFNHIIKNIIPTFPFLEYRLVYILLKPSWNDWNLRFLKLN